MVCTLLRGLLASSPFLLARSFYNCKLTATCYVNKETKWVWYSYIDGHFRCISRWVVIFFASTHIMAKAWQNTIFIFRLFQKQPLNLNYCRLAMRILMVNP